VIDERPNFTRWSPSAWIDRVDRRVIAREICKHLNEVAPRKVVLTRHGVPVERIMSDNGSAYKSFAFRDLLLARGVKHKRTRPYTPRTNGMRAVTRFAQKLRPSHDLL
jgi:transposase InsO family protein